MAHDGLLVIGYGSDLRGDDAAGLLAARRLARLGFHAIAVHQLTPELAEQVAAARQVIFLDADARVASGEIAVERIAATEATGALEHHATPAGVLRLAKEAYGAAPEARVIGLGGRRFHVGARPSSEARRAIARAIAATHAEWLPPSLRGTGSMEIASVEGAFERPWREHLGRHRKPVQPAFSRVS